MASTKTRKGKKSSSRVRVYKFGALSPESEVERKAIFDQLRLGGVYYNDLVTIENGRRDAILEIEKKSKKVSSLFQEEKKLDAEYAELSKQIETDRVQRRSRRDRPELTAAMRKLRARYKSLHTKLAAARTVARTKYREHIKRVDAMAHDLALNARAHCDIHWGTYQLVEASVAQAIKTTWRDDRVRYHRGLRGLISCQIQSKSGKTAMFVNDLVGARGDVSFDRLPTMEGESTRKFKSGRHPSQRVTFSMRVSHKSQPRLLAHFPVLIHRLPPLGVVKRVAIKFERVGPREVWSLLVWIDMAPKAATCGAGTVAVHHGWLKTDKGIRVATWLDTLGNAGEIYAPKTMLERLASVDAIGSAVGREIKKGSPVSIRAKNFLQIRTTLVEWMKTVRRLPDWFEERVGTISKLNQPAKLAILYAYWSAKDPDTGKFLRRFKGDDVGFAALEAWRARDRHLWAYESGRRRRALAHRLDCYRNEAARLATRYGQIVTDDSVFNAKKRGAGAFDDKNPFAADAADENRKIASPSILRMALRSAILGREGTSTIVKSKGISCTCPHCETVTKTSDVRDDHFFVCLSCGLEVELDKVALLNMLRKAGYEEEVSQILERARQALHQLSPTIAAE